MQTLAKPADAARRHRPKTLTVFAAAFAAGAVLAYGVNRVVDIHVVQVEPQVESEPIFVALRSLPQGAPVTVWDVALKDWPKAMLPTTALKADASLEGMVLRHPVREGQPLLSGQLVHDGAALPGSAVAALPATPRPDAAERFLAAPPAESAPAAAASPVATTPGGEEVPAATPAPVAAVTDPPLADVAATVTTPESIGGSTVENWIPAPSSLDFHPWTAADDRAPPQSVAPAPLTSTDVDVSPGVAVVAEPTPAAIDVPVPEPTAATVAVAAAEPLVAPVPALPTTDIEHTLAEAGRIKTTTVAAPASVLDRSIEAEPPVAAPTGPRNHLVIPERIALAADASFTQRPPAGPDADRAARTAPAHDRQPAAPTAAVRGASRGPGAAKPAAAKPAPRKQPVAPQSDARRQADARPQQVPARGLNAWLPQLSAGGRQR